MKKTAPVNKIIPFSNVDGPSNRTAVFFQGCTFNCRFCHNPETIRLCKNCGACVEKCPVQALEQVEGKTVWHQERCVSCDTCIRVCPHLASPKVTWMSVEDVLQKIDQTRPYITGITVSGGECTLYADFLTDLFTACKERGLTCLMDSNGSLEYSAYPELMSVCDGVMLDVKAADPAFSTYLIGNDGSCVKRALEYLLQENKLYEVRTVLFPNMDEQNETTVRYTADKIQDKCFYKLIRYRPFGVRDAFLSELGEETAMKEYAEKYAEMARSCGAVKAYVI